MVTLLRLVYFLFAVAALIAFPWWAVSVVIVGRTLECVFGFLGVIYATQLLYRFLRRLARIIE